MSHFSYLPFIVSTYRYCRSPGELQLHQHHSSLLLTSLIFPYLCYTLMELSSSERASNQTITIQPPPLFLYIFAASRRSWWLERFILTQLLIHHGTIFSLRLSSINVWHHFTQKWPDLAGLILHRRHSGVFHWIDMDCHYSHPLSPLLCSSFLSIEISNLTS